MSAGVIVVLSVLLCKQLERQLQQVRREKEVLAAEVVKLQERLEDRGVTSGGAVTSRSNRKIGKSFCAHVLGLLNDLTVRPKDVSLFSQYSPHIMHDSSSIKSKSSSICMHKSILNFQS